MPLGHVHITRISVGVVCAPSGLRLRLRLWEVLLCERSPRIVPCAGDSLLIMRKLKSKVKSGRQSSDKREREREPVAVPVMGPAPSFWESEVLRPVVRLSAGVRAQTFLYANYFQLIASETLLILTFRWRKYIILR